MSQTYVKVFCILPDWTILHVVYIRVLEAGFQVPSDCVEVGIIFGFYPRLDLVEGDQILDLPVIVHIVIFLRRSMNSVESRRPLRPRNECEDGWRCAR